jgi:hypothetical protein
VKAVIFLRVAAAGGYTAHARCNKHRAVATWAVTPALAVAHAVAAHRRDCSCSGMATAPVREPRELGPEAGRGG